MARSGTAGRRWLILGIAAMTALAWAAGGGRPAPDFATDSEPDAAAMGDGIVAVDSGSRRPEVSDAPARAPLMEGAAGPSDAAAPHVALKPVAGERVPEALESPIARALRMIDQCQARYESVRDYVCTFSKRERIDGRLTTPHVMLMKARTKPRSVYLKFREPAAGREAIFIEGRHAGKVLAHDVGLGRLIAGTLHLDPTGARAMADCRHPITEAGIGPLLNTVESRWMAELDSSESRVDFRDLQVVGSRPCSVIQVTHTRQNPDFMFYQVQLYIDQELGLPIHFEAYDWPANPDALPELVEEYTYSDLRLNVGLADIDFDVANEDYAFGRF